jgi:hypothetical protein
VLDAVRALAAGRPVVVGEDVELPSFFGIHYTGRASPNWSPNPPLPPVTAGRRAELLPAVAVAVSTPGAWYPVRDEDQRAAGFARTLTARGHFPGTPVRLYVPAGGLPGHPRGEEEERAAVVVARVVAASPYGESGALLVCHFAPGPLGEGFARLLAYADRAGLLAPSVREADAAYGALGVSAVYADTSRDGADGAPEEAVVQLVALDLVPAPAHLTQLLCMRSP